jgi:hypothetical protein
MIEVKLVRLMYMLVFILFILNLAHASIIVVLNKDTFISFQRMHR